MRSSVSRSKRRRRLRWRRQLDKAVTLAAAEIGNHVIRNTRRPLAIHDERRDTKRKRAACHWSSMKTKA